MAARPIFKDPNLKGFAKYNPKNLIWLNLFYMNIESIIFLILIFILIVSYQHDTKQCFEILKKPCDFINQFECTGYDQNLPMHTLDTLNDNGGVDYEVPAP